MHVQMAQSVRNVANLPPAKTTCLHNSLFIRLNVLFCTVKTSRLGVPMYCPGTSPVNWLSLSTNSSIRPFPKLVHFCGNDPLKRLWSRYNDRRLSHVELPCTQSTGTVPEKLFCPKSRYRNWAKFKKEGIVPRNWLLNKLSHSVESNKRQC